MVKISKKMFVETLNSIAEEKKKINKANEALDLLVDSFAILTIGDGYLDALLKVLEDVMEDTEYMISWWLFEDVEKKIWLLPNTKYNDSDQEVEVDVSTPELLYDYFVKYAP